MPTISVIDRAGNESGVTGDIDLSVMEIIRTAGFDELLALCGGCCSCATCHVYIDPSFLEHLPALGSDEDDLLDSSDHRKSNSRLSCQIKLSENLNDLRVQIAPED